MISFVHNDFLFYVIFKFGGIQSFSPSFEFYLRKSNHLNFVCIFYCILYSVCNYLLRLADRLVFSLCDVKGGSSF